MVCRPDSTMLLPVVAARTAVLIASPAFGVEDDGASVASTVAPSRSVIAIGFPFYRSDFQRMARAATRACRLWLFIFCRLYAVFVGGRFLAASLVHDGLQSGIDRLLQYFRVVGEYGLFGLGSAELHHPA